MKRSILNTTHVRFDRKKAEQTRIVTFIASTYTPDRHGTVLNQDNWNLKKTSRITLLFFISMRVTAEIFSKNQTLIL